MKRKTVSNAALALLCIAVFGISAFSLQANPFQRKNANGIIEYQCLLANKTRFFIPVLVDGKKAAFLKPAPAKEEPTIAGGSMSIILLSKGSHIFTVLQFNTAGDVLNDNPSFKEEHSADISNFVDKKESGRGYPLPYLVIEEE